MVGIQLASVARHLASGLEDVQRLDPSNPLFYALVNVRRGLLDGAGLSLNMSAIEKTAMDAIGFVKGELVPKVVALEAKGAPPPRPLDKWSSAQLARLAERVQKALDDYAARRQSGDR